MTSRRSRRTSGSSRPRRKPCRYAATNAAAGRSSAANAPKAPLHAGPQTLPCPGPYEDQRSILDAPRLKLRQEVHAEHVELTKAGRGDDAQVARDDVADSDLVDLTGLRGSGPVGGLQDDRCEPGAGVNLGCTYRRLRDGSDGRAAVDQHPAFDAVNRRDDPEVAVGRHADVQLLSRDLLVVESELVGEARQLGLVRRLLKHDEDEESEQAEREGEADESPDIGNALEEHDEQRRADRIERQLLPFGDRVRHGSTFRRDRPAVQARERCRAETLGTPEAYDRF